MRRLNGSRYLSPYGELRKPHHKAREVCLHFGMDLTLSPSTEKRLKRPRAHSPLPLSTPSTPVLSGNARNITAATQRGSTGSQPSTPSLRETKARRETIRETLLRQLPLQEGRMVAFHPPSSGKGADGTSPEDTTWIMARIVKSFHQDKYRYVRRSSTSPHCAA